MINMTPRFENPPSDDSLPLPDEEEEEDSVLTPEEMAQAQAYEFDGRTWYLAENGFMYNQEGKMVTTGRRRQIMAEGRAVRKAA